MDTGETWVEAGITLCGQEDLTLHEKIRLIYNSDLHCCLFSNSDGQLDMPFQGSSTSI